MTTVTLTGDEQQSLDFIVEVGRHPDLVYVAFRRQTHLWRLVDLGLIHAVGCGCPKNERHQPAGEAGCFEIWAPTPAGLEAARS